MSEEILTYQELRQHLRDAVRSQHPEWIEPDGNSPICDSYESRFADLLELFSRSQELIAV